MSYNLYTSLLRMHDSFQPTSESVRLTIDMTSRSLAALREQYGLSAIAGDGSDFDRAVRVMDWLTTHMRHNGMNNPQGERCARTALEFAFDQPDKGVNCAWLATTLTECLLSLGVPARTVYIMPFAPYDCDNHVVTEMWDGERWILLDPTGNAFVRDAAGNLLGVLALREALADQQPIAFNDGLRYNLGPLDARQHRDYLAKDLYWLRIPEQSRAGAPSRFVNVAPVGFDPHRHEQLNIQFRLRTQGDQPWLRDWIRTLEQRSAGHLLCSDTDMALPPFVLR